MAKDKASGSLLERLVPVLLFGSIALAFMVGVLWQKVSMLENGGSKTTTTTTAGQGADAAAGQQAAPTFGKLSEDQAAKLTAVSDADHVRGNKNAKVTLVEYSDFECPFCSKFHPTAQQIMDEYGDQVAWVYRHFPLDQLHPKARPAAEASECVAELGGEDAFWKFADEIFGDQTKLNDLDAIAADVGVNASAYASCVDAGKYKDLVEDNYQKGIEAGVTGTPGNFIVSSNGDTWFVPGAYPYEQIQPLIEEALQG